MPFDYNHIDRLFQKKEAELAIDNSQVDQHWQAMQKQLKATHSNPDTSGSFSRLALVSFTLISFCIIAFLVVKRFTGTTQPLHSFSSHSISSTPQTADTIQQHGQAENINTRPPTRSPMIATDQTLSIKHPLRVKAVNGNNTQPSVNDSAKSEADIVSSTPPSDLAVMETFFSSIRQNAQVFTIDPERDTLLTCEEGSTVFIPAHSLAYKDGSPARFPVEFRVRECYRLADIIAYQLSTVSNQSLLSSGGMLWMQASSNNIELRVKASFALTLKMPTTSFDEKMQLFTSSNEGKNWIPAGQVQAKPFFDEGKNMITVLDVSNDPRSVRKTKNGTVVARFILSEDSRLSVIQITDTLRRRYGNKYDVIKVRRGWKQRRQLASTNTGGQYGCYDGIVGDSINLDVNFASSMGLISKADSAMYASRFAVNIARRREMQNQVDSIKQLYQFGIQNFGWINCDRFLAVDKNLLTNLIVVSGKDFDNHYIQSFLIFRDINSILPTGNMNGTTTFYNVPKGRKASLVSIVAKHGKCYLAIKDVEILDGEVTGLEYKETDPADFRTRTKEMGAVNKG